MWYKKTKLKAAPFITPFPDSTPSLPPPLPRPPPSSTRGMMGGYGQYIEVSVLLLLPCTFSLLWLGLFPQSAVFFRKKSCSDMGFPHRSCQQKSAPAWCPPWAVGESLLRCLEHLLALLLSPWCSLCSDIHYRGPMMPFSWWVCTPTHFISQLAVITQSDIFLFFIW